MATSVVRTIWLRSCSRSLVILVSVVETMGVEEVARIEMLDVALVEPRQRHRFKLEAVVLDVGADRVLHRFDEGRALLLQFLHIHGGGDRAQAVDELGLDQFAQFAGLVGAAAERLGGERNGGGVGLDAQIELRADIDAHAVLGDQRIRPAAGDLEPQRLQIDRCGGVEDRQHERAAVEHDLLPAETGAHIGFVARRSLVEFRQHEADDEDDDNGDCDGDCKFEHVTMPCLMISVTVPRGSRTLRPR